MSNYNFGWIVTYFDCEIIVFFIISGNSIERGSQGYMLYLGAWSGCKHNTVVPSDSQQPLPSGGLTFEPQVGMQTRDVKCQDAYETVVEMR